MVVLVWSIARGSFLGSLVGYSLRVADVPRKSYCSGNCRRQRGSTNLYCRTDGQDDHMAKLALVALPWESVLQSLLAALAGRLGGNPRL